MAGPAEIDGTPWRVLINYGCPRSGTTFMHHVLSAVPDALALKLTESNALHPAQSRDGLWQLARLFRGHRLVFVRIVRHPLEVAASFVAARQIEGAHGLGLNTDRDIAEWVREESTSTMVQRPLLVEEGHCTLLGVRYEALGDEAARDALTSVVGDTEAVRGRLDDYGTHPVRSGRLQAGIEGGLSDEQESYFRATLRKVIGREGYE